MSDFDLLIAGGGMAGAALARGLARENFRVALVDPRPPQALPLTAPWQLRVSTLSPASVNLLRSLDAWQGLASERAWPFGQMRIWESEPGSELVFSAADAGLRTLGWVVENERVRAALWTDPAFTVLSSAIGRIDHTADAACVTLDDGREISAELVIGADGARSSVRAAAGILHQQHPYHQRGVVAVVAGEAGLAGTAWQRFMDSGPLAFLPIGDHHCSIVWSVPDSLATFLVECDEDAFLARLQTASQDRLGRLSLESQRASFPLQRMSAARLFSGRCVLVGDAARVVHPLAGQGANLALLDASALMDILVEARAAGRTLHDPTLLRRYERWRRSDGGLFAQAVHQLGQIYGWTGEAASLRRLGTGVVNGLPWLKGRLVAHAAGFGGRVPSRSRRLLGE